jgi:hypothetical protein
VKPSGILAKPFTPEQLRGRLREALAAPPAGAAGATDPAGPTGPA